MGKKAFSPIGNKTTKEGFTHTKYANYFSFVTLVPKMHKVTDTGQTFLVA